MKLNLPPRRLIPRWRRSKSVLDMPEATFATHGTKHELSLDASGLDGAITKWKASPTTGLLGDILSYSIDDSLRLKIMDLVRDNKLTSAAATPTQTQFITQLLGEPEGDFDSQDHKPSLRETLEVCNPATRREVASLRLLLRVDPANPLALLDLAQFQLSSGHTERAERSVISALSLNPNSRIALRTLARLYVHRRKPAEAHSLISKHARTKVDPWLMATEIALADLAGVPSKFAKKGQSFAKDKLASNAHLSELAGALGGLELEAGNMKRAREMFRMALLAPNDNVVAQAVTHQQILGIELSAPAQRLAVMSAHEARTLLAWNLLDCESAEIHALAWHNEEPFSSRPLQFLTALYSAQGDFKSSEILARRGLLADPKDSALLSNLAYGLASAGKLDLAEKALLRLVSLKQPKYVGVALATAGLLSMQQAQWEAGDELYEIAMRVFRDQKDPVLEALCGAYFARSAARTGHPQRDAILLRAEDLYKEHPSTDAAFVLKLLKPQASPIIEVDIARRLSQWMYDPKTESLIQIHGVTEPGAPALIVKK